MASFKLTDLVVLGSWFAMWPEGGAQTPVGDDAPFSYPEGDFVSLSASVEREDDEFVLYLEAKVGPDPALPFAFNTMLGARFEVDNPELEPARAKNTLVWLCYPYVRELVASTTSRSPLPTYWLPAITRMPDPAVLEAEPQPAE